jgi:predicted transcriptional regulator
MGFSVGTTQYQLNKLEKEGKIVSFSSGFYKSYFANGLFEDNEKKILQILNQKSLREMLLFIIEQKNPTKLDIVNHFHFSYSTATWYIEKLITFDLIIERKTGKFTRYFVNNNFKTIPVIIKLLQNHYSGIWNIWANRLAEFFLLLSDEDGK